MVKNTFYRTFLFALITLISINVSAQFNFTNSNNLLSIPSNSGVAVSVVDLNNDGLDDIVRMDQSTTLVVDMQNMDGTFTNYDLGNITGTCGSNCRVWAMSAADVDHNGWKDIATGTRNAMYLVKLSWTGTTIAANTTTLAGSYFVQNITFGDFNNDGWVDLAVCDDVDYMKIYQNTSGTLNLTSSLINTNINPGLTYSGDPYDSGNYGSVWLDFDNDGDLDLYIAHCRQSTSSNTDQRRRDRLFVNNGSNVYTEDAATYGIEVTDFKQTWTTSFGDIDNDGDLDVVMTNHGENGQILENDGAGHFTDITATTNFTTDVDPMESVLEDFDNDGYLDILICGSVGGFGSPYLLYHNNGNKTFTQVTGIFSTSAMLSFAVGDLNHDGKSDVFSSYGDVYNTPSIYDDVLYLNTVNNSNHFITFNLTGTISNQNAIGARVTIYGAFGKQIREVRAGETYGTSNSMQLHFGLGTSTSIDSAKIDWPAGGVKKFGSLTADQFITSVEGGCSITGNTLPGPYVLCTGQTVNLGAQSGYSSYLWSTSETNQIITVATAGNYSVKVTNGACSNISPSANIQLNPNQTPSVTSSGINYCEGVYTLTSTEALGYAWTGPLGFTANTQSINPPTSGTYSLTIQGNCANFTGSPVAVNILDAPSSPTGTGASGNGPASFNLSASGAGNLTWYDAASAGSVVGTGTNYTTPVINATTTYYVEATTSYPGTIKSGGAKYYSGTSPYSATTINGGLDFDVLNACILKSVKVYSSVAGNREIQLKNSAGTVIDSILVNIPIDTSVVNLNFALTPGTGYRLTTNVIVNYTNFANASPDLRRSTGGVTYPYTLNGLVSINNGWTGSATSSVAYYYFYDWKVQTPTSVCASPRIPVTATVTPAGINEYNENNIAFVYPNPASDKFTVSLNKTVSGMVQVTLVDLAGRIISNDNFNANDKLELNVSGLAKGTYMVKILTENAQSVQRVIKN